MVLNENQKENHHRHHLFSVCFVCLSVCLFVSSFFFLGGGKKRDTPNFQLRFRRLFPLVLKSRCFPVSESCDSLVRLNSMCCFVFLKRRPANNKQQIKASAVYFSRPVYLSISL